MNSTSKKSFQHLLQGIALFAGICATPAFAQDAISAITKRTDTSTSSLAVYDVRPATIGQDRIRDEVVAAIRVNFDNLKVRNQMAPYPLPAGAPRMAFRNAGDIQVPECAGASTVITASDTSFAGSGEGTVLQACIFAYQAGYRVNYYGYFMQRTGGASFGVLGAMLGRVVTNAIGLGDSSRFIHTTVDDIDKRLNGLGANIALVELQPGREGKVVVADPAPAAVANSNRPQNQGQAPQQFSLAAMIPPELAQRLQDVSNQQRAILESAPSPVAQTASPISARKDLSSMGLTYHSQDEFVAAVKRDDKLAVELYLQAQGVNAVQPDSNGLTAAMAAKSPAMKQVLSSYFSAN